MTGPQTPDTGRLEDEDDVEEAAGVVGEAVARKNESPQPGDPQPYDPPPYDEEEASPT